jgi:hypothetical protein
MPMTSTKPNRPPRVDFSSIRDLYLQFYEIFLAGKKPLIISSCGHKIYCFEHHFFHLAGVTVEGINELSIPVERSIILETTEGLGRYKLREGESREVHFTTFEKCRLIPDAQGRGAKTQACWNRV